LLSLRIFSHPLIFSLLFCMKYLLSINTKSQACVTSNQNKSLLFMGVQLHSCHPLSSVGSDNSFLGSCYGTFIDII
jgi:hypothetical protein